MFQEQEAYHVYGSKLPPQEFSSLDTALFFALRMSEASNEPLKIRHWVYDVVTMQYVARMVRTVKPHEFKLNPSFGRQQRQEQRQEAPRPPPPRPNPLAASYAFLGVSEHVDEDGLKVAFRALAKRYHPDMPQGSAAQFRLLSTHFELIKKAKGYK